MQKFFFVDKCHKLYYNKKGIILNKSLEGRECPTVDIETYNKRRKEIVAKQ